LQVSYTEGEMEHYQLPLAFVQGSRAEEIVRTSPEVVLVELRGASKPGWIIDALQDPTICRHLIQSIAQKKRWRGKTGEINALLSGPLNVKKRQAISTLNPVLMSGEQSNTSILYGDQLILKVYRRVDEGVNPDLEIGQFLTHRTSFRNVPAVVGSIEYKRNLSSRITLGLLQKFVPNEGDAWCFTLEALAEFYERALAHQRELPQVPVPSDGLMVLAQTAASPIAERMISTYLSFARLLGQRTAELHIALASDTTDGQFAPEPFSALYQRSLYQSIRSRAAHALATLRQRLDQLPDALRAQAQQVLTLESTIAKRLRTLLDHKITAMRIRCHGDYHLGQVLYTGSDFYIIDFEGEPARSLSERRIKRATFRDVAGMLRSFHYAAFGALWNDVPRSASAGIVRYEDQAALKPWAEFWYAWVTSSFLRAYLQTASTAVFLPKTNEELSILLDACLLEKAVYELGYELNNRPDWVHIPIRGLLALMQSPV